MSVVHKPISISMGEPAGIGMECLLKSWIARNEHSLPPFFLVGDVAFTQAQAQALHLSVPVQPVTHPSQAMDGFKNALPVYPLQLPADVTPGLANPACAAIVQDSIKTATRFALEGEASAIVTLPIHKKTLYQSGFHFPGHTEYLAALCHTTHSTAMMLEMEGLRVVLATAHVSLREAIDLITTDLIVTKTLIAHDALRHMFGMENPRIAIAALNPHAGEQGALGMEETDIILPAIHRLHERGLSVTGPLPADTLFHAQTRQHYDCALCLYHDQGLIPLKTLDFHGGVNITLGLPIVRTSPDHGTAFDIAGKGIANPASLIAAIKRTQHLAITRQTCNAS